MGSYDTIGKAYGAEKGGLMGHVKACLEADGLAASTGGPASDSAAGGGGGCLSRDDLTRVLSPSVEARDAAGQWWTDLTAKDDKESLKLRFRDVFTTLRHDPADKGAAVILVGHSLFFRELVRAHVDAARVTAAAAARLGSTEAAAAFAKDLRDKKLDNAACLRLELEWAAGPGCDPMAPPAIVDAALVLGSGFKEHH